MPFVFFYLFTSGISSHNILLANYKKNFFKIVLLNFCNIDYKCKADEILEMEFHLPDANLLGLIEYLTDFNKFMISRELNIYQVFLLFYLHVLFAIAYPYMYKCFDNINLTIVHYNA